MSLMNCSWKFLHIKVKGWKGSCSYSVIFTKIYSTSGSNFSIVITLGEVWGAGPTKVPYLSRVCELSMFFRLSSATRGVESLNNWSSLSFASIDGRLCVSARLIMLSLLKSIEPVRLLAWEPAIIRERSANCLPSDSACWDILGLMAPF